MRRRKAEESLERQQGAESEASFSPKYPRQAGPTTPVPDENRYDDGQSSDITACVTKQ